eukprot:jgi/Mesvir1/2837/Mv13927-RA.1
MQTCTLPTVAPFVGSFTRGHSAKLSSPAYRGGQVQKLAKPGRVVVSAASDSDHGSVNFLAKCGRAAVVAGVAMTVLGSSPDMALAGSRKVGEFAGSGFIFKDTISVMEISDPKVDGVAIFLSDYTRSITDRLKKDFFNEPSQASLTCVKTGLITVKGDLGGEEGEEVFAEGKNLTFKTVRVRRPKHLG